MEAKSSPTSLLRHRPHWPPTFLGIQEAPQEMHDDVWIVHEARPGQVRLRQSPAAQEDSL